MDYNHNTVTDRPEKAIKESTCVERTVCELESFEKYLSDLRTLLCQLMPSEQAVSVENEKSIWIPCPGSDIRTVGDLLTMCPRTLAKYNDDLCSLTIDLRRLLLA
jgi:hypothetical protein